MKTWKIEIHGKKMDEKCNNYGAETNDYTIITKPLF